MQSLFLGVAGLSTTEIKSDLKELLPPSEDNDTDSDSSLMSDDILDSVYPVQPRSAPRSASDAHGFRYQDYSTSGNNVSVDEALFLIKDISKSHNELYAKEKEREEFEQRCQVRKMIFADWFAYFHVTFSHMNMNICVSSGPRHQLGV